MKYGKLIIVLLFGALSACGGGGGGNDTSAGVATPPPPPALVSLTVTPAGSSIAVGTTQQFTARGTYADNTTQDLTAAVAWTSSSGAVATVSAGGLATGAGAGTATITASSSTTKGSTTLTVTAVPPAAVATTDSAFGVYMSHTLPPHFMQAEGLNDQAMFAWSDQHMATLGAHWTRYSLLADWPLIEPTLGGGYNWGAATPNGVPDTILGAVYRAGNRINTVLSIQPLSLGTTTPTRSPFTNPTEYRAFVQALASRYNVAGGIKVDYYQLANEMQDWFDRGLTADQYGEAAKITLEALRAANPKAQLIMLGGFARGDAAVTLEDRYKQAIQALKSRGVKPVAIDIHWWFWPTAASPWQSPIFQDARAYLDSIGWQDVQIWSMEDGAWTGCPSNLPSLTEEEQALTLVKRFAWGRANGIAKLFWQQLLDLYNFNGQADSPFNSMGLVDDGEQNCSDVSRRNTTRIAYWSYRKLAAATDNLVATPNGTVAGVHDGTAVFAYQYLRKNDAAQLYVVWREGGSGTIALTVPGAAYHLTNLIPDRSGAFAESDLLPVGGTITVNAGTQPILITPGSTPTATAAAIALPRTGQSGCADQSGAPVSCAGTRQDGDLKTGAVWPAPRFTVGAGAEATCVTDNLTGLMWTKDANLPGGPSSWQQALDYVAARNRGEGVCGHNDWRLPNIFELESLVDASQSRPPLPAGHPFVNVQTSVDGKTPYWSATTHAQNTFSAWIVDLTQGGAGVANKGFSTEPSGENNYLWPVRSSQVAGSVQLPVTGQTSCYDGTGNLKPCAATGEDGEARQGVAWPDPRFVDNQDGTVTDRLTGLVWLQDANCLKTRYPGSDTDSPAGDGAVSWQHALDFVAGINNGSYLGCGGGHADWRLPNRKELFSLVDMAGYDPVLPAGHPFANVQPDLYWSSSYTAWFPSGAWIVAMDGGHLGYYAKNADHYVWPVRAGDQL